jgi:hypothetical protein
MAPAGGPAGATSCSRTGRPRQRRQQRARSGSPPSSHGSAQGWPLSQQPASQFCWQSCPLEAQPPHGEIKGCKPCWVAQPVNPTKTTRVITENIARFMSGDSLFALVRLGGKDRIEVREYPLPPSTDIGLTIRRVQKIGRSVSSGKKGTTGSLGTGADVV